MFQYNLRSLLYFMLGVCVLTWLLFVVPGEIGVAVLMCLLMVIPSAVVAGILYFRGMPQAFAIGCVPPVLLIGSIMLLDGAPWRIGPGDAIQIKIVILVALLVVIAGGAVSAGVRWLAAWSRQSGVEAKTFPGLPLDFGQPASSTQRSAGGSASRPLTPDP